MDIFSLHLFELIIVRTMICHVDASDDAVTTLSLHFVNVIREIEEGVWTHMPNTPQLRKKLRSLKLSDWKFKRTDFDSDRTFRYYDHGVRAMWPSCSSLQSAVTGLRDKVCYDLIISFYGLVSDACVYCRWCDL